MEGDLLPCTMYPAPTISIHTLRMEGDNELSDISIDTLLISIHTLRMEGDYFG